MLKGLYEGAQGMMVRQAMQDITANNLANVNSTGFQREVAALHANTVPIKGQDDPNVKLPPGTNALSTDVLSNVETAPGVLQPTGNPNDVSLEGPGYFVVQTAGGDRLLRSATLHANGRGELSTPAGDAVLGADGAPISVGARNWSISADGTVKNDAGATLGRVRLVQPQGNVAPVGGGLYSAAAVTDIPAGTLHLRTGSLERSNVDPVREMVDMISGVRAYEAGQRSILAQDQTLQNLFTLLQ